MPAIRSSAPLRLLTALTLLVTVAVATGCKKESARSAEGAPPALGKPLVEGEVHDLRVTPDGTTALYLAVAQKPRLDGIPRQMLQGELQAAPVNGGGIRRLAQGVVNVPGGYMVTADSRYALVLAGYNPAVSTGELKVIDLKDESKEPVALGTDVSYLLPSPDSKHLAFIASGVLKVGALPSGPYREISGEAQDASWTRDGKMLTYKRKLTAAGTLFLLGIDGGPGPTEPKKLGEQVGEYGFSPDGKRLAFTRRSPSDPNTHDLYTAAGPRWEPKLVANASSGFVFSADGKYLARLEAVRLEDHLGTLVVGPPDGSAGKKIAERVQEFAFAPDSSAIAALAMYDPSGRAGTMTVATLPAGEPKKVGYKVPNFTWAPDGKSFAFLARFFKPIYSVDLMHYRLGDEKAVKVQPGVFGYGFTPDSKSLLFRSACIREARACDLLRVPVPFTEGEQPEKWISGIYTFRNAEEGSKLLVSYARMEKSDLVDLAVFDPETKTHKVVDRRAKLPAYFADEAGTALVYVVGDRERHGVYAATSLQ